ncbi:MAG: discoidin domain-containing protein [Elusimicrobia bacterium]|nr:discoidin domain-containing protein [Elusimicrobiota bacterium]
MIKNIKFRFIILSSIFFLLMSSRVFLNADVTVDFSQSKGTFVKYNGYTNHIFKMKGTKDTQNVKDAGIMLERVFYSPHVICTAEGQYDWTKNMWGYYGSDGLLDDIILEGATPLVTIMQTMPSWLGWPVSNGKWTQYETMIRDILTHIKQKYPGTVYIALFNEPNLSIPATQYSPEYPQAFGVNAGWSNAGISPYGEIYKQFYLHTSNAVKAINAQGGQFKLGGTEISAQPATKLDMIRSFLDFVKANPSLQCDFITYHHYSDVLDDSINSAKGFSLAVRTEMTNRGIDLPQFITEWHYSMNNNPNADISDYNLSYVAAWVAAGWKTLMDTNLGNKIIPFQFALNDYAGFDRSIVAPIPGDGVVTAPANLLRTLPDGTVFPLYNVFKMMSMQKTTRYKADSTTVNVYPLASADNSGIALMISRKGTNESVNVNINNLPVNFQSGNIRFERYLVDRSHSNCMYNINKQYLEKVEDTNLTPRTNHTFTFVPSDTTNSVTLIVMTPSVITSDTTPPTISITSPANNSTVTASLLTVSGTASDNVGLSKVELKVGAGGTYTTVSGTLSPWNGNVTLANGSNLVYAKATDTSNNINETSITVTYTPPPDTTSPSTINTLASGVATSNSVVLSWTSVGDDGNTGTATTYDIRYSNVNITDSNWATATQCSGEPAPLVAGNNQSFTVQGLSAGITYYFAMKVGDEVPNWSGISNVVSKATTAPDITAPSTINTLATGVATSNSIVLSWTSVGDDGNIGTAGVYDIRYSNVNITDSNWATATQCSGEPTPLVAGSNQSYTVQGLSAGITYYFGMKVGDEVPNWSGISNVVSGQTNNQGNIAIGKTVTASTEEGAGLESTKAIDGNVATRWSSQFSDPQWIEIDLGGTYNINQVVLRWEDAYGKDYQIQVSSNNINWTTIYTKTGGTGGVETLSGLSGNGRYIRMYGTARGTTYGYSLWEFEVYGTLVTTPTKSITITYPNGGENLIVGSQPTVTWTSVGGVGNVMLQISVNGGTNWSTLVDSTANDGSEAVTLPNSASSNCLIRLVEISGGTTDSSNTNFTITVTGQMSYANNGNPWLIGIGTTTIELENYDTGGQNEAYYDTTSGNQSGAYRTNEDVDIENCSDTGGGYDIGYAVATEWLEYSVNMSETAEYHIIMRGAILGTASPFHIEFGTHNLTPYRVTPSVTIPDTGGWQIWQDVEVSSRVALSQGNQIMKLVMDTGAGAYNGNFNYIKIIRLTADTTPPVVSIITPVNISGSGTVVTWTTNELANSKVEYGLTTSYGSETPVTDTSGVYSHSVTLSSLTENTTYHYRIVSIDLSGNPTTSGDYSFTTILNDPNPPVISNVSAGVTQNSAVLTWNTDENSDSQVTYGTTTAMGTTTTLDSSMNRLHSVPISGLLKGNTYYYMVYSRDSSGNIATSAQYNFKTYNNNIKHRIYTYYYDDGTTATKVGASTSASLKLLVQVYNLDEGDNIIATNYTGTITLTTKNSKGTELDTIDTMLIEADQGEKEISIPFRSNIATVELSGDTTAPIVINFSDMYIAKLVGYQGGSIRGANGLKILIPIGVLSANKYLAAIQTKVPPSIVNTTKYINTRNPICYDFGELTYGNESAPVLENQVFMRAVSITLPYTAADIGTLNEDGLRIYYWTGTDWDLVSGVQTVDKVNNTVTATVKHFSTYRILGSYVSADLNNIKVYPNPYNPATAVLGKLKVTNLPINSVMKLYSVTGEIIRELKELDFGNLGWLEWDGKNDNGDKVGKGIYIYQIEDASGSKKTGKIGLIK